MSRDTKKVVARLEDIKRVLENRIFQWFGLDVLRSIQEGNNPPGGWEIGELVLLYKRTEKLMYKMSEMSKRNKNNGGKRR